MNRATYLGACLALVLLIPQQISGDQVTSGKSSLSEKVNISGFADLVYSVKPSEDQQTFGIGQFEVGLESELSSATNLSVAVALDDGSIVIGKLVVEHTLYSRTDSTSSNWMINKLLLGGGQFDVPFGIDYLSYASIDRRLVSVPLVVENTHDCWNDYGLYASLSGERWALTLYGVNGIDRHLEAETAEAEPNHVRAFGLQLGLNPIENLRVGGSIAHTAARQNVEDMTIWGLDLQYQLGGLALAGEYISHSPNSPDASQLTVTGFYLRAAYDIDDWFLVSRYGEYDWQTNNEIIPTSWSFGIGRSLTEQIELRMEHQINRTTNNADFVQIVVLF